MIFLPLEKENPDQLRPQNTRNTAKRGKMGRDKKRPFPVNLESDSEEEYVLTCQWHEKDNMPLNPRAASFEPRGETPQSKEDLLLQNCSVGDDLPLNLEKNADHSPSHDIDIDSDNAVSDSDHEVDSSKPPTETGTESSGVHLQYFRPTFVGSEGLLGRVKAVTYL